MSKVKYTGAGAIVEVDVADDGNYVEVGCTNSITAPPEVLTDVEVTCQQDKAADSVPGIEQLSQASFIEPLDYVFSKTLIDDFYEARATKNWRITFVRGANSQVIQFPGYVQGKVPNPAGGNDEVTRTVTITRNGPIEWNPTPP